MALVLPAELSLPAADILVGWLVSAVGRQLAFL